MTLTGTGADSVLSEGELVFLHSDHPEDENSFEEPNKVCAVRWDVAQSPVLDPNPRAASSTGYRMHQQAQD